MAQNDHTSLRCYAPSITQTIFQTNTQAITQNTFKSLKITNTLKMLINDIEGKQADGIRDDRMFYRTVGVS